MAYIYQADIWCDVCGKKIDKLIRQEANDPGDSDDWHFVDSDDGPIHADNDAERDSPTHCAAGKDCFLAEELPSGEKVGLLFGDLTTEGIKYVLEKVAEGRTEVTDLWVEYYTDKGYCFDEDDGTEDLDDDDFDEYGDYYPDDDCTNCDLHSRCSEEYDDEEE